MNRNLESWDNCSTIIVGKNASKTGRVILAHNEDTPNCAAQVHLVPRMQHKAGETLTFADGSAVIPQAEETYGYIWTEFRALGGAYCGEPLGLSQILCKHRNAVQNRAKFLVGGGGETATTCQQYKQEAGCMSRAEASASVHLDP